MWCCTSHSGRKEREEGSRELNEKLDAVDDKVMIHKGLEASAKVHTKVAELGIKELTGSVEHTIREAQDRRQRILRLSDSAIDFVHGRKGVGDAAHRKE